MTQWNGWQQDCNNLFALLQVVNDHIDMIWQEVWFELYDTNLVPLVQSMDRHANSLADNGASWTTLRGFIVPCRDMWFQEDYYDFCDAVCNFAVVFANSIGGGVPQQMVSAFPYLFSVK